MYRIFTDYNLQMNYSIQTEPITIDHQDFLEEMAYQALYVPEGQKPFPRKLIKHPDLAKYYKNWGKPNDLGYAAVDISSHKKVGASWLRLFLEPDKGFGYINDKTPELAISVLPEYRGMGIGTRLMTELLALADKQFSAVCLSVNISNPAVRLYRRFGFATIRQADDSLTMVRHKQDIK